MVQKTFKKDRFPTDAEIEALLQAQEELNQWVKTVTASMESWKRNKEWDSRYTIITSTDHVKAREWNNALDLREKAISKFDDYFNGIKTRDDLIKMEKSYLAKIGELEVAQSES